MTIPTDDDRILAGHRGGHQRRRTSTFPCRARNHRRGLAVNVTRVLYRCPSCGTQEGLKLVRPFSTNSVECSSCFSTWVIDVGCRLAPADENGKAEGDWTPLPEYYRADPLHAPDTHPQRGAARAGSRRSSIYLISRPRFLFKQEKFPNLRLFAFGKAFLTSERLIFRTRIGISLSAPLASIGALSVDPGDKLHFTYEGKLYRIPFRNESALKWYDTMHRLQDEARAGKARRVSLSPFQRLMESRQSVRRFDDRPVPDADILSLVEAARQAPSAENAPALAGSWR